MDYFQGWTEDSFRRAIAAARSIWPRATATQRDKVLHLINWLTNEVSARFGKVVSQ
jgi:hypothetical protein